jgi:hypothetical protein
MKHEVRETCASMQPCRRIPGPIPTSSFRGRENHPRRRTRVGPPAHLLVFVGVFLTAFGSSYYHWSLAATYHWSLAATVCRVRPVQAARAFCLPGLISRKLGGGWRCTVLDHGLSARRTLCQLERVFPNETWGPIESFAPHPSRPSGSDTDALLGLTAI